MVTIWDIIDDWPSQTIKVRPYGPSDHPSDGPPTLDFGPDGSTLAMSLRNGGIKVWPLGKLGSTRRTPEELWSLTGHPRPQGRAEQRHRDPFLTQRRSAVSAGLDQRLKLWNMETGELAIEAPIDPPSDMLMQSLDWSMTGHRFLCGTDKSLRVWSLVPPSWRFYPRSEFFAGTVSFAFSPDEHWLARGGQLRSLIVIDLNQPDSAPVTSPQLYDQLRVAFTGTPGVLRAMNDMGIVQSMEVPGDAVTAVPEVRPDALASERLG